MNSELTIEELDDVCGAQTVTGAVFNGMMDGFQKAGGSLSCRYQGTENAWCGFNSGGETVYVANPPS